MPKKMGLWTIVFSMMAAILVYSAMHFDIRSDDPVGRDGVSLEINAPSEPVAQLKQEMGNPTGGPGGGSVQAYEDEEIKHGNITEDLEAWDHVLATLAEKLRSWLEEQAMETERPEAQEPEAREENDTIAYEIRDLKDQAGQRFREAQEYADQAAELREQGYEDEAMEAEQKSLDLEAEANDLIALAEELISKSQLEPHERGGYDVSMEEGAWEEPEVDHPAEAVNHELEDLKNQAQQLAQEAQEYADQAAELREQGYEDEAMEAEQKAMDLEDKADELLDRAEASASGFRFDEEEKQ